MAHIKHDKTSTEEILRSCSTKGDYTIETSCSFVKVKHITKWCKDEILIINLETITTDSFIGLSHIAILTFIELLSLSQKNIFRSMTFSKSSYCTILTIKMFICF